MGSLFGSLSSSARTLQAQQLAIEVTGHNLANASNAAYARQRARIEAAPAVQTLSGMVGNGAIATGVDQIRDKALDTEILGVTGESSSLAMRQRILDQAQSSLSQSIDRRSSSAEGSAAAQSTGAQHGLNESLSDFFNSFSSLANSPGSQTERKLVLDKINSGLQPDVDKANQLLTGIASLNKQIARAEEASGSFANDLRDIRQARLEELAGVINFSTVENGSMTNIVVDGAVMVDGASQLDSLKLFDAGGGQMFVQAKTGGQTLSITGGSIEGAITVRDGDVAALRQKFNDLASKFIEHVNAIHGAGYGLNGTTGAPLFTGTNASDIAVNPDLSNDPSLLQGSDTAGQSGNNKVLLQIADLGSQPISELQGQTLSQAYGHAVTDLGGALNETNKNVTDSDLNMSMLTRQRDSVSGVSVDEEMTNLVKFQKAFSATAKVVTTIDEMLDTVINMKR